MKTDKMTMCFGVGCPFRHNCYRFQGPIEKATGFFDSTPFDGEKCNYLINFKDETNCNGSDGVGQDDLLG